MGIVEDTSARQFYMDSLSGFESDIPWHCEDRRQLIALWSSSFAMSVDLWKNEICILINVCMVNFINIYPKVQIAVIYKTPFVNYVIIQYIIYL